MSSKATHHVAVERRQEVGTDDLGEPIYDRVEVATDIPVVYRDPGGEYVREDTGERVRKTPTATAATGYVAFEQGDHLVDDALGRLGVVNVAEKHGRYGQTVYQLEVEDI